MTVVCYKHREEIESAISYHDSRLVIYQTYGDDDGATVLWHPDWNDDDDEKEFVKNSSYELGLGECSYYESETQADFKANEYALIRKIRDHSRSSSSDDDNDGLEESLQHHSIKLLSAGYVSYRQFTHRLVEIMTSALGENYSNSESKKAMVAFVSRIIPDLYCKAALSEDLDEMVARMCDTLSHIRSSEIPSPGQHEKVKPSWHGILFDDIPVSRNW